MIWMSVFSSEEYLADVVVSLMYFCKVFMGRLLGEGMIHFNNLLVMPQNQIIAYYLPGVGIHHLVDHPRSITATSHGHHSASHHQQIGCEFNSQADIKGNIKALHPWPLGREIHWCKRASKWTHHDVIHGGLHNQGPVAIIISPWSYHYHILQSGQQYHCHAQCQISKWFHNRNFTNQHVFVIFQFKMRGISYIATYIYIKQWSYHERTTVYLSRLTNNPP